MPIVLRVDGFRVMIFLPTREHGPAHVHVYRAGTEVVILLGEDEAGIEIRENNGMTRTNVIAALRIVMDHADELRTAWRQYHG